MVAEGNHSQEGCKWAETGLRNLEPQQALSCWLARVGASTERNPAGTVIFMSPLDFGQELLGSSSHATLCAYLSPQQLLSRDRLHLRCHKIHYGPTLGLLAPLVLLPVPPLWPTGTAASLPSE